MRIIDLIHLKIHKYILHVSQPSYSCLPDESRLSNMASTVTILP